MGDINDLFQLEASEFVSKRHTRVIDAAKDSPMGGCSPGTQVIMHNKIIINFMAF